LQHLVVVYRHRFPPKLKIVPAERHGEATPLDYSVNCRGSTSSKGQDIATRRLAGCVGTNVILLHSTSVYWTPADNGALTQQTFIDL